MSTGLTRDAQPAGSARRGASSNRATVKHLALTVLLLIACSPLAVGASVLYGTVPGPRPPNVPSLGYQATQTSEFGDLIQFDGTSRILNQVTLVMSDWALASDYPSFPGSSGPTWSHPLTLNLYNVDKQRRESGAGHADRHPDADVRHPLAATGRPDVSRWDGVAGRRRELLQRTGVHGRLRFHGRLRAEPDHLWSCL